MFWKEISLTFLSYDKDHIGNDTPYNSFIVACVLVAAVTILPSHFLTTEGGIHLTEPLPSNDRTTHTNRLMGGIYEVRR
jgi:hypothetical protein